jgi:hypothetical protein
MKRFQKKLYLMARDFKWRLASLIAISALCFSVAGQAAIVLLEGPISALTDNGDGTGSITVMGITVSIPAGAVITTPTATLSIADAADTDPMPGRTQNGFIDGTAIIQGNGTIVAGYIADTIFLEPAENVMGGEVTSLPGAPLSVSGVTMEPTGDPRVPAGPFTNVYGFEVDPVTVPQGSGATSAGYLANDGSAVMKYFEIAVDAGDLINPGNTEVSIIRAQCRPAAIPGDPVELRVLGAVHDFPPVGNVTITSGATVLGVIAPVADIFPFANYTFRLRNDPNFTVCPTSVTADFNGVTITSAVN